MDEQNKPEEVKPDTRECPCEKCETGEYVQEGFTHPNGTQVYKCNECGDEKRFP